MIPHGHWSAGNISWPNSTPAGRGFRQYGPDSPTMWDFTRNLLVVQGQDRFPEDARLGLPGLFDGMHTYGY